jgi:hypothetical protein
VYVYCRLVWKVGHRPDEDDGRLHGAGRVDEVPEAVP